MLDRKKSTFKSPLKIHFLKKFYWHPTLTECRIARSWGRNIKTSLDQKSTCERLLRIYLLKKVNWHPTLTQRRVARSWERNLKTSLNRKKYFRESSNNSFAQQSKLTSNFHWAQSNTELGKNFTMKSNPCLSAFEFKPKVIVLYYTTD